MLYAQPALLPRQSRKRFTLYALISHVGELTVRLVDGGQTRAEQRVRLQTINDQDFLYGIVSDDPAALSYLAGLRPLNRRRVHVALRKDTKDQAAGSPARQASLSTWIQAGLRRTSADHAAPIHDPLSQMGD